MRRWMGGKGVRGSDSYRYLSGMSLLYNCTRGSVNPIIRSNTTCKLFIKEMEDTLVLLHVIFRHGDRTPDEDALYPKDPHNKVDFYPVGHGQLTNKGKQRSYRLGNVLRNNYDHFLGDTYTPGIIDAISSDFDRTKSTLQLILASLFTPKRGQVWDASVPWQPIPYKYTQRSQDKLFLGFTSNSAAVETYKQYMTGPGKDLLQNNSNIVQHIQDNSGLVIDNTRQLLMLACTLKTQEECGLELPHWTKAVWPHPLEEIATCEYDVLAGPKMKRFTNGKLLEKILEDSRLKIDAKSQCKMHLYSGHEISVATTLKCLGVYYKHIPPYCSNVRVELHCVDGIYGIKVYYQTNLEKEPQLMTLPGCDPFCPLETFATLVHDVLKDV